MVLSGLYVFASGVVILTMYLVIVTWGELRAGVSLPWIIFRSGLRLSGLSTQLPPALEVFL